MNDTLIRKISLDTLLENSQLTSQIETLVTQCTHDIMNTVGKSDEFSTALSWNFIETLKNHNIKNPSIKNNEMIYLTDLSEGNIVAVLRVTQLLQSHKWVQWKTNLYYINFAWVDSKFRWRGLIWKLAQSLVHHAFQESLSSWHRCMIAAHIDSENTPSRNAAKKFWLRTMQSKHPKPWKLFYWKILDKPDIFETLLSYLRKFF